ncbi:MAG TPA: hypothetical protein VHT70_00485 [Candidatus Saccharimonadales bacterium]|nr:hypothetical protein [Candidatus Saccharimonadales bacterium]
MRLFGSGEQQLPAPTEPQPLGVEINPDSAALYDEFAANRNFDQVYGLLRDEEITDPTIRQRAVTVLTAPHGYELPYPHSGQSLGHLLAIREEVNGQETTSLRKRVEERPELAAELAQGVLYWLDTTGGRVEGDLIDSRGEYQSAIRELLPVVDEETGDKLFAHYPINDIEPYWDFDRASGYRPLVNLLYDEGVPRKYKEAGLAKWFDVAEREESGAAQPRAEHERAAKNMAEFVQTWTFGERVDADVHTAVVSFLEDHIPAGDTYVDGFATGQVAQHITDEDTRFKFAWRHIAIGPQTEHSQFYIDNDHDRTLVEWLRDQAHARNDFTFDAKADTLVTKYESMLRDQEAAQAAEEDLQARLRGRP